jgi:hypothetical protein
MLHVYLQCIHMYIRMVQESIPSYHTNITYIPVCILYKISECYVMRSQISIYAHLHVLPKASIKRLLKEPGSSRNLTGHHIGKCGTISMHAYAMSFEIAGILSGTAATASYTQRALRNKTLEGITASPFFGPVALCWPQYCQIAPLTLSKDHEQ